VEECPSAVRREQGDSGGYTHFCNTVVNLSIDCCYTITLLVHCIDNVVTLLFHCSRTVGIRAQALLDGSKAIRGGA
jgi:hypothetical protein